MLLIVFTRVLKLSSASIGLGRYSLFVRVCTINVKSEVIIVESKAYKAEEIDKVFIREYTVVNSLESTIVLDGFPKIPLSLTVLVSG
jgi:hypothetical protein